MIRQDGRTHDELRAVRITPGYVNTAPGAALIEMGQTRVLCTVSIEERVPPFLIGTNQGWLTAEYSMLPGSSNKRIPREAATGKINSRGREIQRLIGRSLRSIIDLSLVGERTLYVDCDVIQADGGTRTAAITGAYVALAEALGTLLRDGEIGENPLKEGLAAVSVGIVGNNALLDLCYSEDSQAETDMNVVMTAGGGLVEIQGTAEGRPFTRPEANFMLDLAATGIDQLIACQSQSLS